MYLQRVKFALLILFFFPFIVFADGPSATTTNNTAVDATNAFREQVNRAGEEAARLRREANQNPDDKDKEEAAKKAEENFKKMKAQLDQFDAANKANSENLAKNNPGGQGGGQQGGGGEEKKGTPPPPPPPPPSDEKGGDKKEEAKQPEAAKPPAQAENPLNKIQPPKDDPALAKMLADLKKANEKPAEKKVSESQTASASTSLSDIIATGNKTTADIVAANEAAFMRTATTNTATTQARQEARPKTVGEKIQETALASKRGPAGNSGTVIRANEIPAVGFLPDETEAVDGNAPLAKQLAQRNRRGIAQLGTGTEIIPSLLDLCTQSPGCMPTGVSRPQRPK